MRRGFRPYFESANDYIEFLSGTLIPDLEEDGKRQMANDFKEAVYWLMNSRPGRTTAQARAMKKKRKPTGKTKILNEMAKKKWEAYKKNTPNGKRTYIDIRSQVSRSQEYKKKVKKL